MHNFRSTVWILGDQLLAAHPALLAAERVTGREKMRVVLVESDARTQKHPYQRKKLVLLFSAMRHYAQELREMGYQVDYIKAATFRAGLEQHLREWQPDQLFTMAASEYKGRRWQSEDLAHLLAVPVTVLPNTQFLLGQYHPYPKVDAHKKVIMEHFYRKMRRHFNILMTKEGQPVGGQWNYDKQNRKPLPKKVRPPQVMGFAPDAITQQVMLEVEANSYGVGSVADFQLAVTREQAEAAFEEFLAHRLADFGPYEDAMSTRYQTIFHSVLSPYLNIGLLEPLPLIHAAQDAYRAGQAPINSVEGFIRQILGWREYVYWQYWRQMPGIYQKNSWNAQRPMPSFFWSADTEMNCLKQVITRAIESGYNHHIERLMIICNFCMLSGIHPAAVNDWFLSFYIDAYEWVMLPNVIGMGLNADGGLTGTKPYISSANYIKKMSDFCPACHFNPKKRHGEGACPFNALYWNFLIQHEETLRANPRLGRNVLGLRYLDEVERAAVQAHAKEFLLALGTRSGGTGGNWGELGGTGRN
ncbi:MAG: cryptochrome/photolyase family protein [Ardenticatenaceae bacterium]